MNKEERYEQFFNDFEEWLHTQMDVFTKAANLALQAAQENDEDMNAAAAVLTYQSRLQAYEFLIGKFDNFHKGKEFHDLPDDMLGKKYY
ncbi:MAG: DUF1912 family protein [Streptococcaceae bacterium]|jgi:hypothetical protein|nr:DUF1912 family protein [Streptococcaceae bacterium]